ncbi:MAG: phage tail spike protein [Bullifex sp.]
MKSVITVYQDNDIIFRGRVLDSREGWYKERKITCEGELAFLNDSIIRPYDYITTGQITIKELFTAFIEEHNAQVDEYKRFIVGNVTVEDGDTTNTENLISRSSEDYENTWNSINKKLIEPLGGYLRVRHEADGNYIDYLNDINILAVQKIEFGKNLTDISQLVSGDEMITGIIPLGVKDEETGKRLTIESINDGMDYLVNEEQAALYGRIFQKVVWDDVTIAENLLSKAQSYLTSIGKLTNTIELKAVDISPLDSDLNSFRLGTKVRVKSAPHGIDEILMIEKLTIDLMKPESNKITLGGSKSTFTEQTGTSSSAIEVIGEKLSGAEQAVISLSADLTAKISSEIETSADAIMQSVEESYYTKGDVEALIQSTRTDFKQTDDEFSFFFTKYEADLSDVAAGADAGFELIRKYIRFVEGDVLIGEVGNELILKIQNDRISFLENDVEVAYVSNKKLFITDGTFLNSMTIGNYGFFPRANGNLSLKKIGG